MMAHFDKVCDGTIFYSPPISFPRLSLTRTTSQRESWERSWAFIDIIIISSHQNKTKVTFCIYLERDGTHHCYNCTGIQILWTNQSLLPTPQRFLKVRFLLTSWRKLQTKMLMGRSINTPPPTTVMWGILSSPWTELNRYCILMISFSFCLFLRRGYRRGGGGEEGEVF